ncbi:MAG: SGNH/GDSL hydrolase family protein [Clostridia bacterium]|nr:SGNH/GDSL hydrolase family protein [Clostridia bacterium]
MKKYEGKLFSILGDSISTLVDFSVPRDDSVFYKGERCCEAGIFVPNDTWWGQVIEHLGGKALVNNSISASLVSRHRNCYVESYGCSDERTSFLDKCGILPDVIFVFLGINDWGFATKLKPECEAENNDISIFSVAYDLMIRKLKTNYPDAEIWCFTLPESICSSNPSFEFKPVRRGLHINDYCQIIRDTAERHQCRLIELYGVGEPHDTIDGYHPNRDGMTTIANKIIGQI